MKSPIVRTVCVASCLLVPACATVSAPLRRPPPAPVRPAGDLDRLRASQFARIEDDALAWLAAADPRLAMRAAITAPKEELIARIGTEAMLNEDATVRFRGGSLDLFAFPARVRAFDQAARVVSQFRDPLPNVGPLGSTLARPALERELLERLIQEEKARAEEERGLGDSSGDLVRAIVSTWTPPEVPQDWLERDGWVNKHLLEIRESLRDNRPRLGPSDLDVALYPLERLLSPLQFPRGSAAIAQVRMALDEDTRAPPKVDSPERIARAVKVHLGITVDVPGLLPRLERIEQRLRALAAGALGMTGEERRAVEVRARELLFAEGPCPPVPGSRVRSMAPPPERAAICGALRSLTEDRTASAALVALHDDVLFSFAAIVATPPPLRTRLLSQPDNDAVDAMERTARERPVVVLGVALAAELLYGSDGVQDRLNAWHALGDAPLDVVAREVRGTTASASVATER